MNAKADLVRPSSGRRESWLVTGIMGLILLASGVAVAGRQRVDSTQRLFDWQISAFYDLKPTDQAVYTALSAAAEELWLIHDGLLRYRAVVPGTDPWPTVQVLSDEVLLAPFAKDAAWSQQGETQWTRVASFSFEGSTVYFGSGGKVPGQSAYLVVLSHVHKGASYANGATVWMHPDPNVPAPEKVTRDSLIVNGWKEVVPYSGAMEVERLRGK